MTPNIIKFMCNELAKSHKFNFDENLLKIKKYSILGDIHAFRLTAFETLKMPFNGTTDDAVENLYEKGYCNNINGNECGFLNDFVYKLHEKYGIENTGIEYYQEYDKEYKKIIKCTLKVVGSYNNSY